MFQSNLILMLLFFFLQFSGEKITQPNQPDQGCGGSNYIHESFATYDFGEKQDGYWIFEPRSPQPDSASVVIFMHGYAAYNPMVYGKWIRHLVQRGNIVIFPRYQKRILVPHHSKFPDNTANGIRNAYFELKKEGHVTPKNEPPTMIGHSFGGAITAHLLSELENWDIPKPSAALLVSPGTGPFRSFERDNYSSIPEDVNLLIMVSDGDIVVGDDFGKTVFETAVNTPNRNFIRQFPDDHGEPKISAHHNEVYCNDKAFDSGHHGYAYQRAKRVGDLDAVDFNGYWKLFDALQQCTEEEKNCHVAFGNTPEQRSMGKWSDGIKIKEAEVTLPENWNPRF